MTRTLASSSSAADASPAPAASTAEPVRIRLPEDDNAVTKKVVEWYKKDGDTVKQGEALCEIDAGDVTYDYIAPISGILVRITAQAGSTDLKGGEVIAFMASSVDQVTSVRYEAARELAEGRVQQHGGDVAGLPKAPAENKLREWLMQVGGEDLAEYESALRKDGFDTLEAVATLEESDLDDLGISKKGHRKVLLKAVKELAEGGGKKP